MKLLPLHVLALVLATFTTAQSQNISLINPGFEDPVLSDGDFTIDSVPGYSLSGTSIIGVFNPNDSFFPGTTGGPVPAPGAGNQIAYIFTEGNRTPGALTQTNGVTIAANTVYTLTVAVGQAVASLGRPFAGYQIALLAGNAVVAVETNALTPSPGTFALVDVTFTSGGAGDPNVGQALSLRLASTVSAPGGSTIFETFYDEVRLTAAPVPEPTTTALLGVALLGGFGVIRARRIAKR